MRVLLVVSLVATVLSAALAATSLAAPGRDPGHAWALATQRTDDAQPAAAVAPTAVAPVSGRLLRNFDPPEQPWNAGHRGVALAAAPGDPVVAAMDGVVAFSGEVARQGWVTVEHGGGLATTYGLLDPRAVTAGQRVALGDPLGRLSHAAEHLHWGARLDGAYIHPLSLLGEWRVRLAPADPP